MLCIEMTKNLLSSTNFFQLMNKYLLHAKMEAKKCRQKLLSSQISWHFLEKVSPFTKNDISKKWPHIIQSFKLLKSKKIYLLYHCIHLNCWSKNGFIVIQKLNLRLLYQIWDREIKCKMMWMIWLLNLLISRNI